MRYGRPCRASGVQRTAPPRAGRLVDRDRQRVAPPDVELGRARPHHGLVEEQGAAAGVVAGDQGQIQLAPRHPGDERRGLFAVELDLDAAVPRSKALEHGREVAAGVVVRHAQAHQAGNLVLLQCRLRFGLQVEHAAGVAEQCLALERELETPCATHQQGVADGGLQLLELHADGGLRTVDVGSRAGQRAGIHSGNEALEPIDLQVSHAFEKRMDGGRIVRFSDASLRGTLAAWMP